MGEVGYPYRAKMFDHERIVATLTIMNKDDEREIIEYIYKARISCTHNLPGTCIRLERITTND